MTNLDQLSLSEIRDRLHDQAKTTYDVPPEMSVGKPREAAVLIPFLRINDRWEILFIRRATYEGDRHSGQIAFAGGKREDCDPSLSATALREAQEEVGIKARDVELLGKINHHHTISQFQVTPFVGTVDWPYQLELDDTEVARAFTIPLSWLADSQNYREQKRKHPDASRPWPIVYYDYFDGELLWGATARMTLSLIALLRQSQNE